MTRNIVYTELETHFALPSERRKVVRLIRELADDPATTPEARRTLRRSCWYYLLPWARVSSYIISYPDE